MTVGQMKKLLARFDDDTLLVVSASDHGYRRVGGITACKAEAGFRMMEYYDWDNMSDKNNTVIDVLVVS